jgi:hypothetical protein
MCIHMFIKSSLIGYITQWDFQNKKYVLNERIAQNTVIENILFLFRVQELGVQVSSRMPFIFLHSAVEKFPD